MFDKIGQAAETFAVSASRRGFLGRLGKAALVAAGAVAGTFVFTQEAQANPNQCYLDCMRNCTVWNSMSYCKAACRAFCPK